MQNNPCRIAAGGYQSGRERRGPSTPTALLSTSPPAHREDLPMMDSFFKDMPFFKDAPFFKDGLFAQGLPTVDLAAARGAFVGQAREAAAMQRKLADAQLQQWQAAAEAARQQRDQAAAFGMDAMKASVDAMFSFQQAALDAMAPKAEA